jgi:hypothetical protein
VVTDEIRPTPIEVEPPTQTQPGGSEAGQLQHKDVSKKLRKTSDDEDENAGSNKVIIFT